MNKEIKLNWNGLTEKQQELIERIVNREVLTLCNELILNNQDDIYFENSFEENTNDIKYKEIYQYFIVSVWLFKQLKEIKACITIYEGLYIWGKTDFGQSMEMNHELKKVTKNIIKTEDN